MSLQEKYPSLRDEHTLIDVVKAVLSKHGVVPDSGIVHDLVDATREFVETDANLEGLVNQLETARQELEATRKELAVFKPPPAPPAPAPSQDSADQPPINDSASQGAS